MAMKTEKGQTALELATEFIEGLKKVKSGSEDMNKLFDAFLELEKQPSPPQAIIDMVTHVNHTEFNALNAEVIQHLRPKVSYVLLAWIAASSSAIPDYINTMVGILATYFYSTHSKKEQMTLQWYGETVGKGKIINFRGIWPWARVARTEKGKSIFISIDPKEIYIHQ